MSVKAEVKARTALRSCRVCFSPLLARSRPFLPSRSCSLSLCFLPSSALFLSLNVCVACSPYFRCLFFRCLYRMPSLSNIHERRYSPRLALPSICTCIQRWMIILHRSSDTVRRATYPLPCCMLESESDDPREEREEAAFCGSRPRR